MLTLDAFGQRIRALRIERGLSQQQLGDLVFVTRKTISNWESGHRKPDITMITRLARMLNVKTYDLLDAMGDTEAPPAIILVEDEAVILKGFVHIINDVLPDAQVIGFQAGCEAIEFAQINRVDVAFLDIELFGESGIELAEKLTAINSRTNIIFLTGHSEYTRDALNLHCSGYILKPLTPEKVKEEILHLRFPVRGLET